MDYLLYLSFRMMKEHKKMLILVFMQFFLVFLILLFLSSILFQQHKHFQILNNQIGKNVWIIENHLKNKEKYEFSSEIPSPWQLQQFALLEEYFPGKVGFSYADFNTVPLNNNKMIVLRLSENLFEKLKKALKMNSASYFYTNAFNHSLDKVNIGKQEIKLNGRFLVKEDIPLLFSSRIRNSNSTFFDYIILPAKEIPFNEKLTVINGFLIDVQAEDFKELNITKKLEVYNPEFFYLTHRSIEEQEEKVTQIQTMSKIAVIFTILALCIIFSGILGFILVQFHREKTKLAIFKTLGASNKQLYKLFFLWNACFIVPPFFAAFLVFTLYNFLIAHSVGYLFAIFINLSLLFLLLVIAIIPLIKLNSSALIRELGGVIWGSSN